MNTTSSTKAKCKGTINTTKVSSVTTNFNVFHPKVLKLINTTCQSITQHYFIYNKNIYFQGDMFRPLLGHLQALLENRFKSYLYFNALWDPKCLQIVLYECEIRKFVYIKICMAVSVLKC